MSGYPMRRCVQVALAVVVSLCVQLHAVAADISIKRGDQVVRVDVTSAVQLRQLLDLDLDIWSESVGVGPMDVHASTAERAALTAAGMTFDVLDPDLRTAYDRELARHQVRDLTDFQDYKDFDGIVAFINALAASRPDLCEVISIGQSIEGRDIWVLHVTGPSAGPKPGVFYHGLQHAREWITGSMVMYLAEQLVTQYDTDPCIRALVDRTDFYLAPCVNPDGYIHTWTPAGRLWRLNRRVNADLSVGVDLNRNWAVGWGIEPGSSGVPGSIIYRGTAPFSEPETQALSQFITAHPEIVAYMDYHSYSQLILWPYGYTWEPVPEPDWTVFETVALEMQSLIQGVHGKFYTQGPIHGTIYQAAGTAVDWAYGAADRLAYTIELRPIGSPGFLLPAEEIIPTCEENLPAILRLSEWAWSGLGTFECSCSTMLGDMNGDTTVDGGDIRGFVDVLLKAPYYAECADLAAPSGPPIDNADVAAFVSALLSQ